MNWRVIRLADAVASPWRNGGGVTRELAAWPAGADWSWRISVAEVAAGGPFSRFEGVQRWFAVLDGAGVQLKLRGAVHELMADSAPFSFGGKEPVDCELLGGPTQDLNLMVRQDRASGRMARIAGLSRVVAATARTMAIYSAAHPATLRCDGEALALAPQSLAWRALAAGTEVEISAGSALWMEIEPCE